MFSSPVVSNFSMLNSYVESINLSVGSTFYPWYTGGLFHCYMLDESICHFRGVRSILSLLFNF